MLQSFSELQLAGLEQSVMSICAVCLHHRGLAVSDLPGLALLSQSTQHAFADGLTCSGAMSAAAGHGVGLCPTGVVGGRLTEPAS